MLVLAMDTCLNACSAAVWRDGRTVAARREDMLRGHQERLALMVESVVGEAGVAFSAVDRVGVTVGPGSFTGLRVGLAFAKGLALALDRPLVGVGSLEALAASVPTDGLTAALVDARRGQAYWQAFQAGRALAPPTASVLADIVAELRRLGGPDRMVGPGADLLADAFPDTARQALAGPDPGQLAALAAARAPGGVRPVYLRTPDAKLPGGIEPQW